jgi:hypothetical protein
MDALAKRKSHRSNGVARFSEVVVVKEGSSLFSGRSFTGLWTKQKPPSSGGLNSNDLYRAAFVGLPGSGSQNRKANG